VDGRLFEPEAPDAKKAGREGGGKPEAPAEAGKKTAEETPFAPLPSSPPGLPAGKTVAIVGGTSSRWARRGRSKTARSSCATGRSSRWAGTFRCPTALS